MLVRRARIFCRNRYLVRLVSDLDRRFSTDSANTVTQLLTQYDSQEPISVS